MQEETAPVSNKQDTGVATVPKLRATCGRELDADNEGDCTGMQGRCCMETAVRPREVVLHGAVGRRRMQSFTRAADAANA